MPTKSKTAKPAARRSGRPEPVRMCIDMVPNANKAQRFAQIATTENPENAPFIVGVSMTPQEMAVITSKKWDVGRTLRVAFLDGLKAQHKAVMRVAPEWCKWANVKFEFVSKVREAEIRISFSRPGAWSFIGTDALGIPRTQPTMNFGFLDDGTILHEFGHALGCIHEHQHPDAGIPWDKPKVYKYFGGPPNNWNKGTVDINLFQRYSQTVTQFSSYDPKSIMHYPIDPKLLTDPSKSVGWNRQLSDMDKSYIAQVYPGVANPDVAVSPPAGTADALKDKAVIPLTGTFRFGMVGGRQAIVLG